MPFEGLRPQGMSSKGASNFGLAARQGKTMSWRRLIPDIRYRLDNTRCFTKFTQPQGHEDGVQIYLISSSYLLFNTKAFALVGIIAQSN
jgi:hypothetical protein